MTEHTKHYEISEKSVTNAEELGSDAVLYEKQPPTQFNYDPTKLGTLTAEKLAEIEEMISNGRDAGRGPLDLQNMVYGQLEALGIDLGGAQDGVLVLRFVGMDGKADIRPVVIDAGDFGTRVRNAELSIVEPTHMEEVDPEEERAQEAFVSNLLEDMQNHLRPLEHHIDEHGTEYLRKRTVVDALISEVRQLSRRLMQGEPVDPQSIRQLSEQTASEALRMLNNNATNAEEDSRRSNRFGDDIISDAASESQRRLSKDRQETFRHRLTRISGACQDLAANQSEKAYLAGDMRDNSGKILRILEQLQSDRYGFESYGSQLSQAASQLEDVVNRYGANSRVTGDVISALKREMSQDR